MRWNFVLLGFIAGAVIYCVLLALVMAFFMGADERR